MKRFGIMLLMIAVLMFAGLTVFGNVNEFETKPLMAEALMFPAEQTSEMVECDSVNIVAYAEVATDSIYMNPTNTELKTPDYSFCVTAVKVNPSMATGYELSGGVAVRLICPFCPFCHGVIGNP